MPPHYTLNYNLFMSPRQGLHGQRVCWTTESLSSDAASTGLLSHGHGAVIHAQAWRCLGDDEGSILTSDRQLTAVGWPTWFTGKHLAFIIVIQLGNSTT